MSNDNIIGFDGKPVDQTQPTPSRTFEITTLDGNTEVVDGYLAVWPDMLAIANAQHVLLACFPIENLLSCVAVADSAEQLTLGLPTRGPDEAIN